MREYTFRCASWRKVFPISVFRSRATTNNRGKEKRKGVVGGAITSLISNYTILDDSFDRAYNFFANASVVANRQVALSLHIVFGVCF